jgi:uracil-DNA glycosylase
LSGIITRSSINIIDMTLGDYILASPLYAESKKLALYDGIRKPKILFIGEAPGKEEDKIGVPFVGRSGKVLRTWIDEFRLKPLTGITNSIPFIPLTESGSIRTPTQEEMNYFKPCIFSIIALLRPQIIVLLGNTATKMVLGKQIGLVRHQVVWKFQAHVTAEYHPSYFLRRGETGLQSFSWIFDHLIRQQWPQLFVDMPSPSYGMSEDLGKVL